MNVQSQDAKHFITVIHQHNAQNTAQKDRVILADEVYTRPSVHQPLVISPAHYLGALPAKGTKRKTVLHACAQIVAIRKMIVFAVKHVARLRKIVFV